MPNYIIEGENVGFTSVDKDYLKKFKKWLNDLSVNKYTSLFGAALTAEEEEEWYESQRKRDDWAFFIIHFLEEEEPIGNCSLVEIDHRNRRGEMGIVLGEKDYWNRGLGTESVRLLTDYGFSVLNLHSINLQMKSFNERARRAYEKVGYRSAGKLRDYWYMNGEYYHNIIMDILKDEFYEQNDSLIREKYLDNLDKE